MRLLALPAELYPQMIQCATLSQGCFVIIAEELFLVKWYTNERRNV